MSHQVIVGKTDLTTIPSTYGETLVGLDGRVYTNSKIMGTLDDGTDGIIKINNDGSLRTSGRKILVYQASLAGGGALSPVFIISEPLTTAAQTTPVNGLSTIAPQATNPGIPKRVRIFGNTDNTASFMIQYATFVDANGVYDWQFMDEINPLTINGNIIINKLIECPPNYIRLSNNGGTHQLSIRILIEF
jgi:hypothetical protein